MENEKNEIVSNIVNDESAPMQPTVFEQLIEPVDKILREQDAGLPRHHNQKLSYYDFSRLLLYFFISTPGSLKLFIVTQLNRGLLPAALHLHPVPYTTFLEGFERFPVYLFRDIFQHLLSTLPLKQIPELAALGTLYCIDGSLFPVINSMIWAEYTSKHRALKLHLCFELNRMIPVEFLVTAANGSERKALVEMLTSGVTYIADRGYMSFPVCHKVIQADAHFVFRVKAGLLYSVTKALPVELPEKVRVLFNNVSDELIQYTNDEFKHIYRLVSFSVSGEEFLILTDRCDLTTFQVIMLYAYRWQIELLFRFLKRTMNGIHLIKQDQRGVTIQFYVMLIVALLELRLKQLTADMSDGNDGKLSPDNKNAEIAGTEEVGCSARSQQKCPNAEKSVSGRYHFLETIGKNLERFWKIGIHWLTALKSLLAEPFDRRAIGILSSA